MLSENSKKVWKYLQENEGDFTATDVAEATGLDRKVVDGCFTMSIQKRSEKKYGERVPAEVTLEDGTHKAVKILRLNDAGKTFDIEAASNEQ